MLRIYVDTQAIPAPPATCRTLDDLVAWVRREHLHEGRIVQKLVVNGRNYFTLAPENLDFLMKDPDQFRQIGTVEITSSAVATLVEESLAGALDYSEGLLLGLQAVAQKLRAGQLQEGFHFYTAAVKGILSLMELLSSLEPVLHADYSQKMVNGMSVRAALDRMAPLIQALVAAQERNDLVTMADLLEYDIHDAVGQWKLVLHDFAGAAPGAAPPAAQSSEFRKATSPTGVPTPAVAPTPFL